MNICKITRLLIDALVISQTCRLNLGTSDVVVLGTCLLYLFNGWVARVTGEKWLLWHQHQLTVKLALGRWESFSNREPISLVSSLSCNIVLGFYFILLSIMTPSMLLRNFFLPKEQLAAYFLDK